MELQAEAERRKRAQILESEGTSQAKVNVAEAAKKEQILFAEGKQAEEVLVAKGNVHKLSPKMLSHQPRISILLLNAVTVIIFEILRLWNAFTAVRYHTKACFMSLAEMAVLTSKQHQVVPLVSH